MAKNVGNEAVQEATAIIHPKPEPGEFDLSERVKVKCTSSAPFHKEGEITECAPFVASKFEANGWGSIVKE